MTPPRTDRFTRGIVIITVSPPWGCAAARFVSRHRRRRRAVDGPISSRISRTRSSLRRAARPRSCATRLGPSPHCRRVARCFPHACAVVVGTVPVGGRCKNVCIAAAGRGRRECGGRGRRRRRRKAAALRRRVRRQPELPRAARRREPRLYPAGRAVRALSAIAARSAARLILRRAAPSPLPPRPAPFRQGRFRRGDGVAKRNANECDPLLRRVRAARRRAGSCRKRCARTASRSMTSSPTRRP